MLFPAVVKQPEDYECLFPPRAVGDGAVVARLAPSPTGFIHLGNLYSAFVNERLAHQSGGVLYLRVEDTDDKRLVEGAVEAITSALRFFQIQFDEGAFPEGETGGYGPYHQSVRKDIYHCFVKRLVLDGRAYPCFLTEPEIGAIRKEQEQAKETPGIYGKWAVFRRLPVAEAERRIREGQPYVVRLRSAGTPSAEAGSPGTEAGSRKQVAVEDGIRGMLTLPENEQDIVLLKANGMPTYHLAHVVDDHLMRTTHVVRGEEWLSSLPIHVELFDALGLTPPLYCHTAQLLKLDGAGNKRKLSKREDPELSLEYYRSAGYHPAALREYLLTLLNSDFEEWRIANQDADADAFPFSMGKMSASGALFDINKLNDISKDVLLRIPATALGSFLIAWAKDFRPEVASLLAENEAYLEKILDLGRGGAKPRKDLICAAQIFDFIRYFFDAHFAIEDENPANVSDADAKAILERYLETYDGGDDAALWFEKVRDITAALGYAVKPKDYKKNPALYPGHVGDVSTVIRIALTGRAQSPDLWEIQQILGEKKTRGRIEQRLV